MTHLIQRTPDAARMDEIYAATHKMKLTEEQMFAIVRKYGFRALVQELTT